MTEVREPRDCSPPVVSVVIPTVDRLPHLRRALDGLRRQTYQPFEVIVVVGPCTDGTEAFVRSLPDVKARRVGRRNLSAAYNEGIRAAAGDVIALLDDDAVPNPRWLEELARVYEAEGPTCGGVGGAVVNESVRSRLVQFRHGVVNELGDIDDVRLEPGTADAPDGFWFNRMMGAGMSFRREALLAVGGFDEEYCYLHDETDIAVRVIRAGYRIVHHGRAVVHHYPACGHNRGSDYELNWYEELRSSMYFARKHARQGVWPAVRAVLARHGPLLRRFAGWVLRREISPWAGARYASAWCCGLWSGFWARTGPPALQRDQTCPAFLPFLGRLQPGAKPQVAGGLGRSLRVALVYGNFGTEAGGLTASTHHLAEALADRGHAVVVIRAGWGTYVDRPRGCEVVDIPLPRIQATSMQAAVYETLYELAVERRLDIVDAPLWRGEATAVGMSSLCPLVVRLEGPAALLQPCADPAAVAAERLQLSYAAGAVAVSRAIREAVETAGELHLETHARQARQVPLGLPPTRRLVLRKVHAIEAGGPNFLFAAGPESDQDRMEETFARVVREIPTATLWVVGPVRRRRRTARIHCFGALSEAERNYLFSRCDVFVASVPSDWSGLVFLEAMRFGKPVVGPAAGAVPEVVEAGRTGLLVPSDAPGPLADALLTLGTDAALRRHLGEAGRERFEDEFALHLRAVRMEQFYRRILETWDGRLVHATAVGPTVVWRQARAA